MFRLSLSVNMFPDYQKEIDLFVSNGLIIKNESNISFTHQSFLDYFITASHLEKIYSGVSVSDLIGSPEMQTPNIRYRLLFILQSLMDADKELFVQQCKNIMQSDTVRYYFKCTVFEIIGQCDNPDEFILDFAYLYFKDSIWHDVVWTNVYLGHPAFVLSLNDIPETAWMKEKNLLLLHSICDKYPDFVVDKLHSFAFKNEEDDREIFSTLCYDISNDSEKMFQFRINLLNHNPIFFNLLGYLLFRSKTMLSV